jgi:predicted deacylase
VLQGEVRRRDPPGTIIDGRDTTNYVIVEEAGLFEGLLEPGAAVSAGDPVGRLWFPDTPERPPTILCAPLDGLLACIRALPVVEAGDSAFVTGQPIAPEALLE